MNQPLTPAEKRLIEREFIANEQAQQKRRAFLRRVFLIGITAGSTYGLLRGLVWERHGLTFFEAWVAPNLSWQLGGIY